MDAVHSVGVHVVRKTARAADTANEDDLLAGHADLRQHLFHLSEDRVVAAAGAPADVLVAGKIGGGKWRGCCTHDLFLVRFWILDFLFWIGTLGWIANPK